MNFESRTSKNGKHYFLLLNDNSEVVIQSEMYKSSERVSGGMALVEDWYPRGLALRTNKNDRFYYVLEDGDGNILGRCPGSRSFEDSREAWSFAASATRREVENLPEQNSDTIVIAAPPPQKVSSFIKTRRRFLRVRWLEKMDHRERIGRMPRNLLEFDVGGAEPCLLCLGAPRGVRWLSHSFGREQSH